MVMVRVRWNHDTAFIENGVTIELARNDEDIMDRQRAEAFRATGELEILEEIDERR